MVWLGASYLFQTYLICTKLSRMTNKHDSNYKTLIMNRDKALEQCVQILTRCRKLNKQAIYANFGLLSLCFLQAEQHPTFKVPKLKEPEEYSNAIKVMDEYYGYIAWALICLKLKKHSEEKVELGQNVLQELIDTNTSRPEAYLALWSVEYLNKQNYTNALNIAEQLFICATDYQSFQEKLLLTVIYAKSLRRGQEPLKALTLLQLEYSKSPHYTSLLYLYGKYSVTASVSEHQQQLFHGSGVGALDECLRQCVWPHRQERVRYYRGVAYQQEGRRIRAHMNFKQFINQQFQEQSLSKLENIATFLNKFDSNFYPKVGEIYHMLLTNKELLPEKQALLKKQNLHELYQKVYDSDPFDADLFKALFLYKVNNEIMNADIMFQRIIKDFRKTSINREVEAQLEYLRYLRRRGTFLPAHNVLAKQLLETVDSNEQVPTTLWVQAHIEIAKLENQRGEIDQAVQLLTLLRQVLPPIDTQQLSDFKLPFNLDEYHEKPLYQRAQHLFQEGLYVIPEQSEGLVSRGVTEKKGADADDEGFDFGHEQIFRNTLEMREGGKQVMSSFISENNPENEDETPQQQQNPGGNGLTRINSAQEGLFKVHSKLTGVGIESRPSMAFHKKKTSIMFFAQTPQIEGEPMLQQSHTQFEPRTRRGYSIRSSMPKVALMNILQKQQQQSLNDSQLLGALLPNHDQEERNLELEAINEYMKDTNFSVYSDPKFLYLMGKMCARSGNIIYADLALQSFHDYFLIITYYKDQMRESDYTLIKVKSFTWLARVFLSCHQHDPCEQLLNAIYLDAQAQEGTAVHAAFEEAWGQLHRAKGCMLRQNLVVDHFYGGHFRVQQGRYLD
ncbi:hypothetical protein FGO68_gene4779 [Halteria grandinella]|uniref:Tetratricopeptide repeat protein n=1 Tax=Halteria grandinella TaxID=5974 RepID=A0A8J8TAJ7_HALGN|nr:hypothetical protein FGO68_gene4779 [Halteria grandinella]